MLEIKDQLIKAVVDLLNDEFEIEEITVRQIAYEANTSVGIINYHFGSKWNLIVAAVSSIIDEAVKEVKYLAVQIVAPIQYIFLKSQGLKTYLGETADIVLLEEYEKIMESFLTRLGT